MNGRITGLAVVALSVIAVPATAQIDEDRVAEYFAEREHGEAWRRSGS